MNLLALHVCRYVLPRILKRACEARISRSGDAGAAVNCFVLSIDQPDQPYLMVMSVSGDNLECMEWDGARYSMERSVPLSGLSIRDFRITHFYGLSEIQFVGLNDFLWNRAVPWHYIRILVRRRLENVDQYFFNKKKLVTKQRIDLLKLLLDRALEGRTDNSAVDLMTDLHSIRWVFHPHGEAEQRRLEFYLGALVETGDLRMVNHRYVLTGLALRAIEEYEEQERKHTESVKMQWRTFWLTTAIVGLTVIQAGLIKLPAIIDRTDKVVAVGSK